MAEYPLDPLVEWLRERSTAQAIAGQVTVRTSGAETSAAIDHLLACPLPEHDGWRVSTKATYLPKTHFDSWARHRLNNAKDRRAICCHDRGTGEVVAALSYHVDARANMPVLITAIGLRVDARDTAFETYRTLAGVLVAKQYVHALASKIGRGDHVDLDLANPKDEHLMKRLGFRRAPHVRDFRPGGVHLRQPPLRAQG